MSSKYTATGRDKYLPPVFQQTDDDQEFNSEIKMRNIFFDSANNDGTINNNQEWDCLIAMFLKHRILSVEDTKRLDRVRPTYPIYFETLITTI